MNTKIVKSYMFAESRQFFVIAKKDIQTTRRILSQECYICIDPDVEPQEGAMVLVDLNLEPWAGQSNIRGVATMFGTEII